MTHNEYAHLCATFGLQLIHARREPGSHPADLQQICLMLIDQIQHDYSAKEAIAIVVGIVMYLERFDRSLKSPAYDFTFALESFAGIAG